MATQIKLITVTTLITLLIWVMADQSLTGVREVRAVVELVPAGASDLVVTTDPPGAIHIRLLVTGHKDALEALREDAVRISLPVKDRPAGTYVLDLVKELPPHPEPLKGVAIESVQPETIKILVDRTVKLTVPIRVEPGDIEYDIPPTVEPDHVTVQMAQSALQRIQQDSRDLYVSVDAFRFLADEPEGKLIQKDIPLVEPRVGGVAVRTEPDKLKLSASLREHRRNAAIKAVPIRFEAQFDVFNSFAIERRSNEALLTQAINVKGPAEVVDKLVSGEIKASGVIQFTANDTVDGAGFRYYTPKFYLPPGVELIEDPAPIELRLVRRGEPAP